MSKKLQLHIPLPCHEDWNNMTTVQQGKFCASCQKAVIDFTDMSDEQVISYFKKPSIGSVCGRFQENQLNRNMQMPRRTLPWIKYFFQFALPAFLISMKADAQKDKIGKVAAVCVNEIKGDTVIRVPDILSGPTIIKGKVIDYQGLAIPGATVMIKGTHRGVTTDHDGNFSIVPEPSNYFTTVIVSSVGFDSFEKTFRIRELIPEVITMKLLPRLLGEVVITASDGHRMGGLRFVSVVGCTKASLKDSIIAPFLKFSVYPNPVIAGQTITIANNKLANDNYDVEIINLAGQTVHKELLVINDKQTTNLKTPLVTAGTYVLKLTGKKSLKTYSKKIIVQ